jgi:hypothetical protein
METKNDKLKDNQICRALITPSQNGEGFDFSALAIPTANKQLRFSWDNNEYFYQVLKTGKENIDVSRMDSGLPLFDNHPYEQSGRNLLGITTGYEFTGEGVRMDVKLGSRADDAMRKDIKDGILKTVSIEGEILEYEIIRTAGEIPVYNAILWQPSSLSFAPVPQDIGAQIEVKRALNEQLQKSQPEKSQFNLLISKF